MGASLSGAVSNEAPSRAAGTCLGRDGRKKETDAVSAGHAKVAEWGRVRADVLRGEGGDLLVGVGSNYFSGARGREEYFIFYFIRYLKHCSAYLSAKK